MWTRSQIKREGKIAFKSNYGRSVLAGMIMLLVTQGVAFQSVSLSDEQLEFFLEYGTMRMALQILRAAAPGLILTLIVYIFLLKPIEVGLKRFFVLNGKAPAKMGECLYAFKSNYWNVVSAMFLREIYLLLWSCLFLIPGFIKAYSYRMVPYILAEEPDLKATEAISRSKEMMKGQKWKTFVLDLSFLGWNILSVLTFEIAGMLYAEPYICSTNAQLYEALRTSSGRRSSSGRSSSDVSGENFDEYGPYDEPDRHDDAWY